MKGKERKDEAMRSRAAALVVVIALLAACGGAGSGADTAPDSSPVATDQPATTGPQESAPEETTSPEEPGEVQQVTFWQFSTSERTIAAYEKAIADFEAEHPDIDVVMEIVPWAEQQEKITTALATGELPDVSMLGNNVVAQFQAQGALEPMDRYFEQWSEEEGIDIVSDFWPGDEYYYKLDGQWYATPLAEETRVLYYRKDLFEQAGLDPDNPPDTWEEMRAAAQALASIDGIVPWALPMSLDYLTLQTFISVYLSNGARMLSGGECGFNTPEFIESLTYYTDIYLDGLSTPEAATYGEAEINDLFATGGAAMVINGPWVWRQIEETNPDMIENVGVAPIPAGPEGRFGFLGGWPLVLWSSSDVKDAAAEWIHWVTSPQGALSEISQGPGYPPGRRSAAQEPPWTDFPMNVVIEGLEYAYPYQYPDPEIPQMGAIEVETIQAAVQRVAIGAATPEESTAQLCSDLNAFLSR